MNTMLHRSSLATLLVAGALALVGCGGGDTGGQGAQGPQGPAGPPGPSGNIVTVTSNAAPASDAAAAAWAALAPKATVTSVTIASPPVVNFTVTDENDRPIAGLGNKSKGTKATAAQLSNLAFSLAKLVPAANGAPSRWVSYIVTTVPTYNKDQPNADTTTVGPFPQRPGTDTTGKLTDHGDGTYTYEFYRDVTKIAADVAGLANNPDTTNYVAGQDKADLGDLAFDPNLVHRLTIQISGNAPGTGTNTPTGVAFSTVPGVPMVKPLDVIYDFIPATGQAVTTSGRDIVATAKCAECHRVLGGIPGDNPESSGAGFHGGARNETRYCVMCHTEQRKFGRGEATFNATTLTFSNSTYRVDNRAVGNLPNHIHKIHMGGLLAKKSYNYANVLYNEVKFPQDIRNCTKCHDGSASSSAQTAQGDNWKNAPNRLACGGCHDGINFATGQGVTIGDAAKGLTSTTSFNGFAHGGLAQADDSLCGQCHTSTAIDLVHLPVTPPNPNNSLDVALVQGETSGNSNTNSAWIASNTSRLPAGAIKVTYDIKSVARVSVNGVQRPQMVFRMLQNGNRVDFKSFVAPAPTATDPEKWANLASQEIWDNFMGAPSVYFVYAVPQDGIAKPADFNASASVYLRSLWNGMASTSGTLTGPDANGYYTATLTGVTIPDSAVMLTGGLGYSYAVRTTLPLTQTNLANYPVALSPLAATQMSTVVPVPSSTPEKLDPRMPNKRGGLIVIAPNAQKVASAGCVDASPTPTGACVSGSGAAAASGAYAGRRPIVEDARCNKCHQELGTFTEDAFHGGQRNDGSTCAWCHTPNRTSSGWSADSTSFIHAIHGGNKRKKAFTWHASSTSESFADVTYPGVLRQCETCHLPGTYDFSATASAASLPRRLYRTVGQGVYNGTAGATAPSTLCQVTTIDDCKATALSVFMLSPYVVKDNAFDYGYWFFYNATASTSSATPSGSGFGRPTVAAGGTREASPTTLVNSPIAGVCFACHDSDLAKAHMEVNQGSLYVPRSTALNTVETCMVCHDTGRIADIKVMHSK